jgi:hypothetical protein
MVLAQAFFIWTGVLLVDRVHSQEWLCHRWRWLCQSFEL